MERKRERECVYNELKNLWWLSGMHCVCVYVCQVRYLKIIEKSGYQALPWVRYITQNGDYQLRTQWTEYQLGPAANHSWLLSTRSVLGTSWVMSWHILQQRCSVAVNYNLIVYRSCNKKLHEIFLNGFVVSYPFIVLAYWLASGLQKKTTLFIPNVLLWRRLMARTWFTL